MATTEGEQPTIAFACVACGSKYRVAAKFAGRRTSCTKCQAELTVPAAQTKPADPFAHLVSFGCRLCGTRMSVPARRVGEKARCPDCETFTVIPPPPAPAASRRPAAMDGKQYEVYEGVQPHGSDLARAETPSIRFVCHVCQTPLAAEVTQVGEFVPCPDCRASTRVPTPPESIRHANPLVDEYDVDEAVPTDTVEKRSLFDEYVSKPPAGYRGNNEPDTKASQREAREYQQADAAGWGLGLFQGMPQAFGTSGMALAWFGLSAGLLFVTALGGTTVGLLSSMASKYGAIGGIFLFTTSVAVAMILVGVASSIFWAVLDSTASGARRVRNWPSIDATDWFEPTLYVMFGAVVAAIPGTLLASTLREKLSAPWPLDMTLGWIVAGAWLTAPWIWLSQLDNGSPWAIFSSRLMRTLRHAPVTWLVFYAVTLAILLVDLTASTQLVKWMGPGAVLLTCPIEIAVDLTYFWLLGRLAWVAGSKTPEGESSANAD